jgi:hypothetical protein
MAQGTMRIDASCAYPVSGAGKITVSIRLGFFRCNGGLRKDLARAAALDKQARDADVAVGCFERMAPP